MAAARIRERVLERSDGRLLHAGGGVVRRLVLLAATLVLAALLVLHFRGGAAAPPPPVANTAIPVPVTPIVQQTVPVYLEYIGTTTAFQQVTLEAQVTGYFMKPAVADGADVKQGQLLYEIDPSSYQAALDQAAAQAERDTAALRYAKANRHRNLLMSKTGDTSIDAFELATSTQYQDEAALTADQAAIEMAKINLGHTDIRAPFSGRLSYRLVDQGALISPGTPINTLAELDPIYATFNPPDGDLPEIEAVQAKSPVEVDVLAGEDKPRVYRGQLTFLDNTVGPTTGTITMRATIANPDHTLLPGQFVRVRLHITDRPDTLLVPQAAVGSSQVGKYLYVVGQGNEIEQRYVTLGSAYGAMVAITKGANEGQLVAIGNLLKIGPGAVVKPVASPQHAARRRAAND
jgi:membrane fusion protein, multidrug efflux system